MLWVLTDRGKGVYVGDFLLLPHPNLASPRLKTSEA